MARNRSQEEILNQVMYAIAAVVAHYGPGYNAEGLHELRQMIAGSETFFCDSEWRVDVIEDKQSPNPDFCPSIIPDGTSGLNFATVVKKSLTGEDSD
jgi:hypothetical protein